MKHVTDGIEPERLWRYFEELSAIPRGSGNEAGAIRYIADCAERFGLKYRLDGAGNAVVYKPPSPGLEKMPVVVLQSHVDMVCEKNAGNSHDFSRDPIEIVIDGEWIKARDTTLGADNGIGVGAMLALLEDDAFQAGGIECIFTVEEETGLTGAALLEKNTVHGRFLINLDAENSGTLYIGCAGGRDTDLYVGRDGVKTEPEGVFFRMGVQGLTGGHSGGEIHIGRGNAVKLTARMLFGLSESVPFFLSSIQGGDKHNAIPRECFAVICLNKDGIADAEKRLSDSWAELKEEYGKTDPKADFTFESHPPSGCFDRETTSKILNILMAVPHGVIAMSSEMEGLVETSTNLSSVRTEDRTVHLHASHRSSRGSGLAWVAGMHRCVGLLAGLKEEDIVQEEGYPSWSPDPNSKLLAYAKKGVLRALGREPDVRAIHAGLECSVIKKKFEAMDVVAFGPTIRGPHSPDERVHISSVLDFWNILTETLYSIYEGAGADPEFFRKEG